jgi:hypothetical protein
MKLSFLKVLLITAICSLAFSLAPLRAQSTNKVPAEKKSTKDQKDSEHKSAHPFHGKLAAIDKNAKTITVGKSVYQITSETKIKKSEKPALLEDGMVGEPVSGYAKPGENGKMVASTLYFGAKAESAAGKKTPPRK